MLNGQEFQSLFLVFELSQPIWDCYSCCKSNGNVFRKFRKSLARIKIFFLEVKKWQTQMINLKKKRIKVAVIANEFFELYQGRMGGFGWATRQVTNYFNSNSNLGKEGRKWVSKTHNQDNFQKVFSGLCKKAKVY